MWAAISGLPWKCSCLALSSFKTCKTQTWNKHAANKSAKSPNSLYLHGSKGQSSQLATEDKKYITPSYSIQNSTLSVLFPCSSDDSNCLPFSFCSLVQWLLMVDKDICPDMGGVFLVWLYIFRLGKCICVNIRIELSMLGLSTFTPLGKI